MLKKASHPWHMAGFGLVWYYWMVTILYPGEVGFGLGDTFLRASSLAMVIVGFALCILARRWFKRRSVAMSIYVIAAICLSTMTSIAFFSGTFFSVPEVLRVANPFFATAKGVLLFSFLELLTLYRADDVRFSLVSSISFGLILYVLCMVLNMINLVAFGIVETCFGLLSIPLYWYSLLHAPRISSQADPVIEGIAFKKSIVRISCIMVMFGMLIGMSEIGIRGAGRPLFLVLPPALAVPVLVCFAVFLQSHNKVSDILQWGKLGVVLGSIGVMLQLVSLDYGRLSTFVTFPSYVCFFTAMLVFCASVVNYQNKVSVSVLLSAALMADSAGLAIGFLAHTFLTAVNESALVFILFVMTAFFVVAGAFLFNKHTLFPLSSSSKPLEMAARETYISCVQISKDAGLTQRQEEVFIALAQGKRPEAIAEELVLSPNTVRGHIKAVYAKLGVHSHTEMMSLVLEEPIRTVG